MWWLLIPAAVAIGTAVVRANKQSKRVVVPPVVPQPRPVASPILAGNIADLRLRLDLRPARPRIFIVGLGGAGKSSLIDAITSEGCTPRPVVGIMTDATDWSRAKAPTTMDWGDVLVVDIPGYATTQHPSDFLAQHLPFSKADIVLFAIAGKALADDCSVFRAAAIAAADRLWIVRTKADTVHGAAPAEILDAARNGLSAPTATPIFLVSSITGVGISELHGSIEVALSNARIHRAAEQRA